jgi:hypothetical protein
MSEHNQFKLYVKHEMETRLTEFPDLGYDANEVELNEYDSDYDEDDHKFKKVDLMDENGIK